MERIYINNNWEFWKKGEENRVKVRIPHANTETPFNYFDEGIYQFESCYEKEIFADISWQEGSTFLTFEGVAHVAKVYLNGEFICEHKGGYTAFCCDISTFLKFGEKNILRVEVDSRESCDIPPFGNVIDYLTYGGIYRDVFLEVLPKTHISDIFPCGNSQKLSVETSFEGEISGLFAKYFLKKIGDKHFFEIHSQEIKENKTEFEISISDIELWDIDNPVRYEIKCEISKNGDKIHEKTAIFGFKDSHFKKDGYYLNGKKVKIFGLNRHQSYPYVGYAMPKRPQVLDADILKFELGLNAVRTSHYPQSQYFLDRCDEIGLLVFTEITGWQHIGGEDWKETAILTAREMVLQNRNHPSIILWGARINESQDDNEFYQKTNAEIRNLDKSRQTGGVRFIKNSNLLEDVYTYNDFSHTGENAGLEPKSKVTSDVNAPYLVSEYNGHMFPTKGFDSEIHRLSHAKRHANVIEAMHKNADIAGAFGWCMFDYNTHKDFGSGDRICYHGVMNMFRIPKLAAAVYSSQAEVSNVLEVSSSMDIGEHAGGNIAEVYAFTNAEFVNLYKNGEFVKSFYPCKKEYGNMPHPPILIDDFIGELIEKHEGYSHKNAERIKEVLRGVAKFGQNNLPIKLKLKMAMVMIGEKLSLTDGVRLYYNYVGNWGGEATVYRFDAVKNGEVVKSVLKSATKEVGLKVICDTNVLQECESYDVATVRVEITNENGEILPYYQGVVSFEASGEIEIIGEKAVCAAGGGVATYVKTTGKTGSGTLKIKTSCGKSETVEFKII